MSIIQRRIKKYFGTDDVLNASIRGETESEGELLKTIKYSKNIFKLKLPKATYE